MQPSGFSPHLEFMSVMLLAEYLLSIRALQMGIENIKAFCPDT